MIKENLKTSKEKTMLDKTKQELLKIHTFYMDKFKFYNTWHAQPNSSKIHKITLALFTLLAIGSALVLIPYLPHRAKAASSYFVSKTGCSDSYVGSEAQPWCTIQKAANSVNAGDTVYVKAGTYNERVIISPSHSGTAQSKVRIIADGTVIVTQGFEVQASYIELDGFEIRDGYQTGNDFIGQVHVTGSYNKFTNFNIHDVLRSGFSFNPSSSNCTIENFSITSTGYGDGIVLSDRERGAGTVPYGTIFTKNYGANNITIKNGTIAHHGGWAGINIYGDNHLIENVTIIGGPSGDPANGTKDGDGIRIGYSSGVIIRNVTIHDLWEWYTSVHHVDCIQMYIEVYNLLIENSKLGTWEANAGSTIPTVAGPTQLMMIGTVYANSHIDFEVKNTLFLGQTGTGASIVTAKQSGATINIKLTNNTFWSSYPSLNSVNGAVLRNNVFRSFYIYPANLSGIDSNYNAFFWVTGSGSNNVPSGEGVNSLGKTYTTRVSTSALASIDVSASTDWGLNTDWRPSAGSPLIGAGEGGVDIGAFPYQGSGPSCPNSADINKDSHVNISDAAILMAKWGQTVSNDVADINCDGRVNISDAAILMARWGT